jgi:tellurite resistance protein TerC
VSLAVLASEASTSSDDFASFEVPLWIWAAFLAFVTVLLVADLLLVHRKPHAPTIKEAAVESAVWISIGVAFTGVVFAWHGGGAAGEYISGYLIEKSLSVDNVFVWSLIMSYFAVPRAYQFRVLFWGVFGALVLRFVFIFAGIALLEQFEWMLFVFGGFLVFTAARMVRHDDGEVHPEQNPALRLLRRVIPSTSEYDGQRMFVRHRGRWLATPLLAVLIVIETSDVVFAVDSIPAILAVSREQFIVFSSNAFAILGLRALYFLLADLRDRFHYLQQGLAVILAFVGVKMIITEWVHLRTELSLGVIAGVLTVAIVASIKRPLPEKPDEDEPVPVMTAFGSGEPLPPAGGTNGADAAGGPPANGSAFGATAVGSNGTSSSNDAPPGDQSGSSSRWSRRRSSADKP